MKRLIHNRMTVNQQFEQMKRFEDIVNAAWEKHSSSKDRNNIQMKRDFVEERFGIRCKAVESVNYYPARLLEPRIVDEKKCLFYLISVP